MEYKANPIKRIRLFRLSLVTASGILLGLSFPPSPFYSLAYIAFIPFFYFLVSNNSFYQTTIYSYLFLFIFHLLTVYWTGGFIIAKDYWMMIAGAALLILHPIFFLPFTLSSFFVKKRLGLIPGLIAFALFWTSFEYLHSLGEYSFPWLTIGNSQAYDINRIQIVEYTSVYGLTILIFAFNIIAFILLWRLSNGEFRLRSKNGITMIIVLIVVYFAPLIYGKIIVEKNSTEQFDYIRVGIIQPNFDPWEKWGGMTSEKWDSYLDQFNTYINETKLLKQSNPEIVFWPETAIPFHFLLPRYSNYLNNLLTLSDTLQLPIFTGFPMVEYFNELEAPVTAERLGTSNIFVESYNSTILIKPRRLLGPIHRKTILVPFAERIPYAETFRFLIEPLKWNVGISSWGKGGDTIVYALDLHQNHNIKFSGMICYESAYPDYVRQFVKHGAEFLVIITNDSWWGNTSGAYQHASFASLRAVETRRWIVQCANGGISMVVDPTGAIRTATKLFTRTKFVDDIGLRKDITFVVEYGDIVAHICLALSLLIIVIAFLRPQNINKDKNGNN